VVKSHGLGLIPAIRAALDGRLFVSPCTTFTSNNGTRIGYLKLPSYRSRQVSMSSFFGGSIGAVGCA
jgi:hypothetical protein